MQKFKENDTVETDVTNLALPSLEAIGASLDDFYDNAFACYLLGDVLYDLDRDPLRESIAREVYRASFPAIHDLFTAPGTFEFYLDVFRKIFTDDTDITFTIPAPGKLVITVLAATLEQYTLVAREIVDGAYVYSPIVTSDTNDNIVTQDIAGIKTQAEIDSLIKEISAYGIYTTAVLTTP